VRVEWFAGDVRREADANAMVAAAVERFGGVDIIVNNAATGILVDVAEMTGDQWRETVETNLSGVFYCTRAAIPHLRGRGGGWILNISSLASRNPFPRGAAYSATKAGLNAFGEALMQELRYDGIRVSTICPGSVHTAFAGSDAGAAADWKLAPEDVARVVVDLIAHPGRSLPSLVDIRPSMPPRKK
jgi:NAD(P)-dependent dehydrogenase (short-subunit alcohol dehydrogenase family)